MYNNKYMFKVEYNPYVNQEQIFFVSEKSLKIFQDALKEFVLNTQVQPKPGYIFRLLQKLFMP